VQGVAARTFLEVVGLFRSRYRYGVSADETRRDRKEFLIYDMMGPVLYEVERAELEAERVIHPVVVRVVPTEFRADWYRDAPAGERDFRALIDEMISDDARNELVLGVIQAAVSSGDVPVLAFTHRREHAELVADRELSVARGLPCGLLLGGAGADRERFQDDLAKLGRGVLEAAIGTYNSIGVGIDLPAIRTGVATTPISAANRQFFGQVRGRICRSADGKDSATLFYLWDRHVFPGHLNVLRAWNDDRVEILEDGRWVPVRGR
jgi:superfamily II DNA or RNA helicase